MSSSIFPLRITDTFIPFLWTFPSSQLTIDYVDTHYLKYPIGQGSQTIPGLSLTGTPTSSQVGYVYSGSYLAPTFTATNTPVTYGTINLTAGTYIISGMLYYNPSTAVVGFGNAGITPGTPTEYLPTAISSINSNGTGNTIFSMSAVYTTTSPITMYLALSVNYTSGPPLASSSYFYFKAVRIA
jgi:hypothetical protein